MTKKVILALGCLALLATFTTAAMADSVTFSFSVTTGTVTTIADAGPPNPSLKGGPVSGAVVVKDTNTSLVLTLPSGSNGMIQSEGNIGYLQTSLILVATYAGAGVIETEVLDPSLSICTSGICLSGTNSFGTYTAMRNDGGGWGGVYTVTFVDPAILTYFGDTGQTINPHGGNAFTTAFNVWAPAGGTLTSSAEFGSGTITFQTTPVPKTPEPGTLALMGTGIIGLAGLLRRKKA